LPVNKLRENLGKIRGKKNKKTLSLIFVFLKSVWQGNISDTALPLLIYFLFFIGFF
jgi:hypothetical protein